MLFWHELCMLELIWLTVYLDSVLHTPSGHSGVKQPETMVFEGIGTIIILSYTMH